MGKNALSHYWEADVKSLAGLKIVQTAIKVMMAARPTFTWGIKNSYRPVEERDGLPLNGFYLISSNKFLEGRKVRGC